MLLSLAFPKNVFLQSLELTYSINTEIQNNPLYVNTFLNVYHLQMECQ